MKGEHNFFIWDELNGITRMFFTQDGDSKYIGVNDNLIPAANFDVNGTIRSSILGGASSTDIVQANSNGILGNISITSFAPNLNYWHSNGTDVYRTNTEGKVFIGMNPCPSCTTGSYRLYVEGGIKAREIKVTAIPFPDFVFDKKYKLRSLPELEQYISENKHLPNIPSAAEIEKNEGIEIGDMQTKLLQTIEEQALYIIDLQKQMNLLKEEVASIKK